MSYMDTFRNSRTACAGQTKCNRLFIDMYKSYIKTLTAYIKTDTFRRLRNVRRFWSTWFTHHWIWVTRIHLGIPGLRAPGQTKCNRLFIDMYKRYIKALTTYVKTDTFRRLRNVRKFWTQNMKLNGYIYNFSDLMLLKTFDVNWILT